MVAASALLGSACGGGGGSTGSSNGGSVSSFGAVSVTALGALAAPVVIPSQGYTMTGIGGAEITAASINFPPLIPSNTAVMYDNSSFAYSANDSTWMLNLSTGDPYPLANGSADTQPSIYSIGTRVLTSEYVNGAYQIFSTHMDGIGRYQVTNEPGAYFREPVFVDGVGIVFTDESTRKLKLVPTGSSVIGDLYDDGNLYRAPEISPDRQNLAFIKIVSGIETLMVAPPNGSGTPTAVYSTGNVGELLYTWLPGGELLVGTNNGDDTATFAKANVSGQLVGNYYLVPGNFTSLTAAPDGFTIVLADGTSELKTFSLADGELEDFMHLSGSIRSVNWGPYQNTRHMVGPLSYGIPEASGLLITQAYSKVGSYVVFDATTPSGVTITPHSTSLGGLSIVCTVEASDELTMLKYTASSASSYPTPVVTPSRPVTGAIVSFNALDGTVASVITYTSNSLTRSPDNKTLTFKGDFVGVWDAKGKDQRPNGAHEVQIDASSGKVLSIR